MVERNWNILKPPWKKHLRRVGLVPPDLAQGWDQPCCRFARSSDCLFMLGPHACWFMFLPVVVIVFCRMSQTSLLKRNCVQEHVSASSAPDPSLGSLSCSNNCATVSLCCWKILEHVCLFDVFAIPMPYISKRLFWPFCFGTCFFLQVSARIVRLHQSDPKALNQANELPSADT